VDRLYTGRQVDYAQASMPQSYVIIEINPRLIRTAVAKDTYHILQDIQRYAIWAINMTNTCYSTHIVPSQESLNIKDHRL
jgi:hypothetical protein